VHQYTAAQEGLYIARKEYPLTKQTQLDADGTAALGICESLILALTDSSILSEKDARDLLADVASTHQAALDLSENPEKHHAVIAIVERILAAKNGVRH
jgi:hypothetical protein